MQKKRSTVAEMEKMDMKKVPLPEKSLLEQLDLPGVSGTVSGDSESADRNSFQDRRTFGFESGSSGADGGNAPCFHFSGR